MRFANILTPVLIIYSGLCTLKRISSVVPQTCRGVLVCRRKALISRLIIERWNKFHCGPNNAPQQNNKHWNLCCMLKTLEPSYAERWNIKLRKVWVQYTVKGCNRLQWMDSKGCGFIWDLNSSLSQRQESSVAEEAAHKYKLHLVIPQCGSQHTSNYWPILTVVRKHTWWYSVWWSFC